MQAWGVKPERKPAVQLVPEQMVELAAEIEPTGRATCRRCLSRIPQGSLRCGIVTRVPMFGQSNLNLALALALAQALALALALAPTASVNPNRLRQP